MKSINLFASNNCIEIKKFKGGECHVKLSDDLTETEKVRINARLTSSDDIMNLCLTVDALRNMDVPYIEAFIPYVPYARQYRVMTQGEPLSIKVFANIINSLHLDKVTVYDAHSDVATALIHNSRNTQNHVMVRYFLKELNVQDYVLVSPDLGAYKKTHKLSEVLGYMGNIATTVKVRDVATGEITKMDLMTEDLKGKPCVVVDDICDGGRTFIELAAQLKAKNAGDLYLIVSHGIFSHNALDKLKEAGYRHVCSSNSIAKREDDDFYRQFNVF